MKSLVILPNGFVKTLGETKKDQLLDRLGDYPDIEKYGTEAAAYLILRNTTSYLLEHLELKMFNDFYQAMIKNLGKEKAVDSALVADEPSQAVPLTAISEHSIEPLSHSEQNRVTYKYMNQLIIAIDGPSASGKGTVAKKIAAHFNLPYLNTGALYRLVAFRVIEQKIDTTNFSDTKNFNADSASIEFRNLLNSLTQNISEADLENEALFGEDVGAVASVIAKNPLLRKKLFTFQQEFIAKDKHEKSGAVLDGRDTTTVICPDATYKFFITADVEIRAKRRFEQLKNQGKNITYEEILAQLKQRDENDSGRKDSPLLIASDAIVIDNGNLSINEGFEKVLSYIAK